MIQIQPDYQRNGRPFSKTNYKHLVVVGTIKWESEWHGTTTNDEDLFRVYVVVLLVMVFSPSTLFSSFLRPFSPLLLFIHVGCQSVIASRRQIGYAFRIESDRKDSEKKEWGERKSSFGRFHGWKLLEKESHSFSPGDNRLNSTVSVEKPAATRREKKQRSWIIVSTAATMLETRRISSS